MSVGGLLAGATGLVGGLVLPGLLARVRQEQGVLVVPSRRPLAFTDPALANLVGGIDAPRLAREVASTLRARNAGLDVFVSCLGTTIRQAGSQAAFHAIDFALVRDLAEIALKHGARQAIVVSSVGADARSRNFYLRTKGALEEELASLGFKRCDFLQPGLLIGDRGGPARLAEGLGQRWLPRIDPLLRGRLSAYRSIRAEQVAAAIVALYGRRETGVFRHVFADMRALAVPV